MLLLLSAGAAWFVASNGWTLWWGDAQAHLAIARRIVDSRTPGYEQIGTVWLPLPHWLMLPLVHLDDLWRSGTAGVPAPAMAFVMGGLFLFGAVRRLLNGQAAAWAALLVYALNPNLLYLQSIPMTEPFMLCAWLGVIYFGVRWQESQRLLFSAAAGVMGLAGSLIRYDGWWLLPFAALWILLAGGGKRWRGAFVFCILAGVGPLFWFAHNYYFYSDALEFYRGPYSAMQITHGGAAPGAPRYPGDRNLPVAARYFAESARLVLGAPLFWLGLAGAALLLWLRRLGPLLLLLAVPVFYFYSLYGAGTPIFVPTLWPNSYYNTRFGINLLPLAAFGIAAIVALPGPRFSRWLAPVLVLASSALWMAYPRPNTWICWKESQVNSERRRQWTAESAAYLKSVYRPGDGVFTSFGDLAGVFREAQIPLREALHEGNGPAWLGALHRPDLMLFEKWTLCLSGDKVCLALDRAEREDRPRARYTWERVRMIANPQSPSIEIWRRKDRPRA